MITPVFPPTPESIQKVAALLKQGEVVALPTETVYGLAGNATSPSAVLKIFQAKERPSFDPLIVHVSDSLLKTLSPLKTLIDQKLVAPTVAHWVCAPDIDRTIKKFWPGPLTLILPKGSAIPNEVTSGEPTVGLRCPAHPLFQAVLSNLDFPLAAPSANRFGRISPTQASHVVEELDQKIAGILDGGTSSVGVESTIIRIEDPLKITLLRPGKIGVRELEIHFNCEILQMQAKGQQNKTKIAPGMLDEHYAPKKPLILLPISFTFKNRALTFLDDFPQSDQDAYLSMNATPSYIKSRKNAVTKSLSSENNIEEMAQELFAALRALDQNPNVTIIYCDVPMEEGTGLSAAIRDRLKRASRNKPLA